MSRRISTRHPVAVVLGTRPEAVKLAPVIRELRRRDVPTHVLSTGQHREMLRQVLDAFDLTPDTDLDVMRPDQTLSGLSARLLDTADAVLDRLTPARVVVQGDTTTVAMMALAAFYRRLPVAHVEAGLRTGRRYDPFPEEMNRSLLGRLASLHFAPTERAARALAAEGVPEAAVQVTGNTVVDALRFMEERVRPRPFADFDLPAALEDTGPERPLMVVTGHRRESFGEGFEGIFTGLAELARRHPKALLVYPVHLNPNVHGPAHERLAGLDNVLLLEPLGYAPFLKLLTSARLVVTDSGGIQEEAASLGVPVLVTRATSERLEAVDAGVAELVGTDPETLVRSADRLLTDPVAHAERAVPTDVFGDGRAAERIVSRLLVEDRSVPETTPVSGDTP